MVDPVHAFHRVHFFRMMNVDRAEEIAVPDDCGIRRYGGKMRKCRYRL